MTRIQLLTQVVLNPKKYQHTCNLPLRFDAAEELYIHHAAIISDKVYQACGQVLIKSGKYIQA